jgi:hypothetical protein
LGVFFFWVHFSLNLLTVKIFLVLIFGIFFPFLSYSSESFEFFFFFLVRFSLKSSDLEILLVLFLGFFLKYFSLESLELLGIGFWDLFLGLIFSFYAHR